MLNFLEQYGTLHNIVCQNLLNDSNFWGLLGKRLYTTKRKTFFSVSPYHGIFISNMTSQVPMLLSDN